MKTIKAVIFDYDGVLCSDYFYWPLAKTYPEIYKAINQQIFKQSHEAINQWMTGQISYRRTNQIIGQTIQAEPEMLDKILIAGIKQSNLNYPLIEFAQELRNSDIKTGILTDNMDVFSLYTVPHFQLDKTFNPIYNSAALGQLKHEHHWQILHQMITKMETDFSHALVIDDSPKIGQHVKQQNGHFYLYPKGNRIRDAKKFIAWYKNNYK